MNACVESSMYVCVRVQCCAELKPVRYQRSSQVPNSRTGEMTYDE